MSESDRTTADSTVAAAQLRAAAAGSIVAGLEPFDWDQDEAIAYEVAIDTIGLVIATYTGLIADEQRSATPDLARVQEFEEQISRAATDQHALVGKTPDEVQRVTATYAAQLRPLPNPLPLSIRETGR